MSIASQLQSSWLRKGCLAWLLLPVASLYGAAVLLRAACYRFGLMRSVRLPVPVIVVGNVIAGGAGKTPTTMALIHLLRARGFKPGIVSRGYGRLSNETSLLERTTPASLAGDEPLLMHLRTGAPVAVGADRVAAAHLLLSTDPSIDILISDDGLQHRRLARDAQVIVFDERGVGNGWLLPAGPLREPVPQTVPRRSVVLYNANSPSTGLPGHLAMRRLAGVNSLAHWWSGKPVQADGFDALRGLPLIAAAGLARPERFFDMLRTQGLSITEMALPDHCDFAVPPWPADGSNVIVTEKDAVKLKLGAKGSTRVWVATLDFELSPAFASELMQWLPHIHQT